MSAQDPLKKDFESFLRRAFKKPLDGIAGFLLKIGLTPNHITLLGLLGNIGAAILIGMGELRWAGLLAGFMAPLDAVDGAMARLRGTSSKFGAFFDSTIDRYDELILLAGLAFHFYNIGSLAGVMLTFAAAIGSVMVSYTRARAEALGFQASVGFLTRVGRAIVLVIGLLFAQALPSVGIIAILANITAIQRIFAVWRQSKAS
ncbi:MAG: CDP-alcohol phosphatidyltransferase family protein [Anaerolineaceae bacterium]|jgi:CDP-diacylglycerol--glycerol-3-phosphate 3-phosphatidyltransferase